MTSPAGGSLGWRGVGARIVTVALLAMAFAAFMFQSGNPAHGSGSIASGMPAQDGLAAAAGDSMGLALVARHQAGPTLHIAPIASPDPTAIRVTLQAFEPHRLTPQAFGDWDGSDATPK